MPEAAVALKQGAGRLIRRESDQGILVVGDTRLVTMGYGKRFSAEPTLIADDVAKQLLDDIIARNPDQRVELMAIRGRMPWGRKAVRAE